MRVHIKHGNVLTDQRNQSLSAAISALEKAELALINQTERAEPRETQMFNQLSLRSHPWLV